MPRKSTITEPRGLWAGAPPRPPRGRGAARLRAGPTSLAPRRCAASGGTAAGRCRGAKAPRSSRSPAAAITNRHCERSEAIPARLDEAVLRWHYEEPHPRPPPGQALRKPRSGCLAGRTVPVPAADRNIHTLSEVPRRTVERAPHMRRRAVVEAQPFLRLTEIPADHVLELFQFDMQVGVEGIDVVDADHARRHVPFVLAGALVFRLDVRLGAVVGAEILDVGFGVRIA